ncbi:MAG: zinc-ribbon domain-containing protein [Lachnospiraceae bacterium]|nr:zinc-ribbon domain-containing protein [Lachnospiraceae bacterium]
MFCPKCGNLNADNIRFCSKCGADIAARSKAQPIQQPVQQQPAARPAQQPYVAPQQYNASPQYGAPQYYNTPQYRAPQYGASRQYYNAPQQPQYNYQQPQAPQYNYGGYQQVPPQQYQYVQQPAYRPVQQQPVQPQYRQPIQQQSVRPQPVPQPMQQPVRPQPAPQQVQQQARPAQPTPQAKPQAAPQQTHAQPKAQEPKPQAQPKPAIPRKSEIFKIQASTAMGEAVYGSLKQEVVSSVSEKVSFGSVIGNGFKQFFQGLGSCLKNPKYIILTLLVIIFYFVVWLVLNILQSLGINPWPLKILSFLTCADGGMSGGFLGGVGGIVGKGVFVSGIITFISPLFRKKGSSKRSFGDTLKGTFLIKREMIGYYVLGIGIALIIYIFITGGATRIACLCGVGAMIVSARSAVNNGFLSRIIGSLIPGKNAAGGAGLGLMKGYVIGFAISVFLGVVTGTRFIPILLSFPIILTGILLIILNLVGVIKPKKEVQA